MISKEELLKYLGDHKINIDPSELLYKISTCSSAIHIKTNNEYHILDICTNCTNSHEGQVMIIYSRKECVETYVRELGEFLDKFTLS